MPCNKFIRNPSGICQVLLELNLAITEQRSFSKTNNDKPSHPLYWTTEWVYVLHYPHYAV